MAVFDLLSTLPPRFLPVGESGADAPSSKGAYVLFLRLNHPVTFPWRRPAAHSRNIHSPKNPAPKNPAPKNPAPKNPLPDNPSTTRTLDAGMYLYAGSAYGPGGIAARLRHHLRRGKRPHWHIDHLTNAAHSIHAFAQIGGQECRIIRHLCTSGHFTTPLAGFGSSDCRTCTAHLLCFRG